MKTNIIVRSIAALALLVAVTSSVQAADPVLKTYFGDKAIGDYDTVAYHAGGKPVKGAKGYSYRWKGANWHFSSAANLSKFKASPEKFATQYGGCAWAAASNKLVKSDPEVFDINNGKLYLNYNEKKPDGVARGHGRHDQTRQRKLSSFD